MKINFFSWLIIKVTMLMFMASSIATSCSARSNNIDSNNAPYVDMDSVMHKALGDSIYSIVSKAKRMKADVIKMDSTSSQNGFFIRDKYIHLVKFVLSDPIIYNNSTPAYGSFIPCFSLTFIKRKERCMAKFDFGLKKWAICDAKGTCLKTFDLSSDDMLRVANLLFPDNKHFQSLINVETK